MTEIAEVVTPPEVLLKDQHTKKECPFCQDGEPDGPATIYAGNSTDLGADLGNKPDWWIQSVTVDGERYSIRIHSVPNAHHIIPAEASLHGEFLHSSHPSGDILQNHPIMQYMSSKAKGSKVKTDIGYDVNKAHNGVWLPSVPDEFKEHEVANKVIPARIVKWGPGLKDPEKQRVAERFITKRGVNRQWHTSHPAYSRRLDEWLQGFVAKLESWDFDRCPEVDDNDEKFPAPMGLLARLKGLTNYIRPKLTGSYKRWRTPMFTSGEAEKYCVASVEED